MIKKLNVASLMLLAMPWHHGANASSILHGTAMPSLQPQARCMSVMSGYAPVSGQKNTFTRVTVGCGIPIPSGFTQQLPAGALVVKPAAPTNIIQGPVSTAIPTIETGSVLSRSVIHGPMVPIAKPRIGITVNPTAPIGSKLAAPIDNKAILPEPNVSQIKWHAMGYRYPDGHGGIVHVDEKDKTFHIFVDNKKTSSGVVPSGKLQKRPPMYVVYDWLLQKWQANHNDNASYYLAPTAASKLSRNMSIRPDGSLDVQLLPQPIRTGSIKWLANGYSYTTDNNSTVFVNDKTGKAHLELPTKLKLDLPNIPSNILEKREPMYIVYDWLLQKWQANHNDNASYYLAPTPECALSRNMSIGPDGSLSVQIVPQPAQTGATQSTNQRYKSPAYNNQITTPLNKMQQSPAQLPPVSKIVAE